MCFETTDAPTPADALRLYCAIAWDWGQVALGRRDISQSYPLQLEPARQLGKMLLGRVKLLRKSWIPQARRGLARARKESLSDFRRDKGGRYARILPHASGER